jgi:hypothetical protein
MPNGTDKEPAAAARASAGTDAQVKPKASSAAAGGDSGTVDDPQPPSGNGVDSTGDGVDGSGGGVDSGGGGVG